MRVCVRLFASLRDRIPDAARGQAELTLPDGTSLQELIERLEIPAVQAQMVLVNGEQAPRKEEARRDVTLAEGDTVSIFPPLAGG